MANESLNNLREGCLA